MGDPVPTYEAVTTAIATEIASLVPADLASGTTIHEFAPPLEDESEYHELEDQRADKTMDAFFIDGPSDEEEGEADGESYSIYRFTVAYRSIRLVQDWSKLAHKESEKVKSKLNKNLAVFAIGGQRHLRTTETAREVSADFVDVNGHRVYEIQLEIDVEARRFT